MKTDGIWGSALGILSQGWVYHTALGWHHTHGFCLIPATVSGGNTEHSLPGLCGIRISLGVGAFISVVEMVQAQMSVPGWGGRSQKGKLQGAGTEWLGRGQSHQILSGQGLIFPLLLGCGAPSAEGRTRLTHLQELVKVWAGMGSFPREYQSSVI